MTTRAFLQSNRQPRSTSQSAGSTFRPTQFLEPEHSDIEYVPSRSSLNAIAELDDANILCSRLQDQFEGTAPKISVCKELFDSVVDVCSKCRSALAMWDLDENLHGPSTNRAALHQSMRKSLELIKRAQRHPILRSQAKLIDTYTKHIEKRISLLESAINTSWDEYERKKRAYLLEARTRRGRHDSP